MTTPAYPIRFWFETLAIVAAAFVLTVVFTRPLIGWLSAREFGKAIRADGPAHGGKAGTPTMGGFGMLAAIALVALYLSLRLHSMFPLVVLAGMVPFAALGLIDDLRGLARRSGVREVGVGLTARRMFALQLASALVICIPLFWLPYPDSTPLARLAAGAIAAVVLVATVNAVNISDGLDGLAAGLCAIAFACTGLTAAMDVGVDQFLLRQVPVDVGVTPTGPTATMTLTLAIAAAALGFLVFNRHPARVFMGNVASMALGAGLALVWLAEAPIRDAPLPPLPPLTPLSLAIVALALVGAVFYAEVVSDVLQVTYFKVTGGRRLFRMAPIHHHFELMGWPETRVVRSFWIVGALFAFLLIILRLAVWALALVALAMHTIA
jgi:phospho-N-acetylmuramoyl-pentapeptide-transferase